MGNGVSFYRPTRDMMMAANAAMLGGGAPMYSGYSARGVFRGKAQDAVFSGMAYLTGELEKVDPKVREPLSSVTWQRDISAKTGGGWVDYTSTFDVDFGTTGPNDQSIISGSSNTVPVMQVNTSKNLFKVFTWGHMMQISFIDQAKVKQIGRSLEDLINKGIRLNYNKTLDQNVYKGFTRLGTTGLLNDANVVVTTAAKGASGKLAWATKTPDEILQDINQALVDAWIASEYDLDGMPNHILVPPSQYAYLVKQKVSEAGNISVLNYLLENNIAKNQGRDIIIEPCRWCIKAGSGGTDRMLVYVNDEDKVNFDITVPINRMATDIDLRATAYLTLYVAQIGQVKFNYYQPVRYVDGI